MNCTEKVKDTAQLENEIENIGNNQDIEAYLCMNQESMRSFSLPEYLEHLLEQKGLTKAEVIERSKLDKVYAYHIFSGRKRPGREKILALAIAMELSVEETQFLLYCAGVRQLYVRNPWDSVIFYALKKKMKIIDVNCLLMQLGENVVLV